VASGTSFGSESAAVTSCDAVCIRLLVRANRTSPIAIPTENTAMNPTPIMPPFRGGLRLIGSSFKSLKMTAMKWAGSDVPVLRRWCAGLVYQFAEAATKFHVKDFFKAVSVRAFLIRQRIKLLFQ
jgi:hypothetical protein